MTVPPVEAFADTPGHAFNNLLCRIIGSAELALDRVTDPLARGEINAIIALAEAGGGMVAALTIQTAQTVTGPAKT